MPRDTAPACDDVARGVSNSSASSAIAGHTPALPNFIHGNPGPLVGVPDAGASAALGDVGPPVLSWPDPDLSLLDEHNGAPPAFPLDVLPPLWRDWTQAATRRTGAPVDYVAMALLASAASVMSGCSVMPGPGWVEPCVLWTALVGPPSSGKTPAVEAACDLLWGLEAALAAAKGSTGEDPLFTNGTTLDSVLASVGRAMRRNPLLIRDEQGGWLAHMARGSRDGSAQAFWLAAWCDRGLELGWRGKTLHLDGVALSILGTVHPEALEQAQRRDDGGALSRFLFVRPPLSLEAWQPSSDAAALRPAAVSALRRLRTLPRGTRTLSLATPAQDAFVRFGRGHRVAMADLAGKAAAWWGKGPSQVLRLAGVLTLLDWAASDEAAVPAQVPGWALEAAVRLWQEHLWPHAQATFRVGSGGEDEARQRQALRWLALKRLPLVSREHIRREALSQTLDAQGTDRVIEALVEGGWLLPVESPKGRRGRRPRRWLVRSELWGNPPAAGKEVAAAVPRQHDARGGDADAGISAIPATIIERVAAMVPAGPGIESAPAIPAISAVAVESVAVVVPEGPAADVAPAFGAISATGFEAAAASVAPDLESPRAISAISASRSEDIGDAKPPGAAAFDVPAPGERCAAPLASGTPRPDKRARRRARRKQRALWRSGVGPMCPAVAPTLP